MSNRAKHFYEFGPYRIDPSKRLLMRDGDPVALTSKALETLLVLIERSERVVSKDELMKALWPDTFVEEANLTQHISMVRRALGETPKEHRYVVTLPGRGYCFAERVRVVLQDGADLKVFGHPLPQADVEQSRAIPTQEASELPVVEDERRVRQANKPTRFPWEVATGATIVVVGLALGGWLFFSRRSVHAAST
jgi:DNA-binding winged helix-turn-helix (wHTH) protein